MKLAAGTALNEGDCTADFPAVKHPVLLPRAICQRHRRAGSRPATPPECAVARIIPLFVNGPALPARAWATSKRGTQYRPKNSKTNIMTMKPTPEYLSLRRQGARESHDPPSGISDRRKIRGIPSPTVSPGLCWPYPVKLRAVGGAALKLKLLFLLMLLAACKDDQHTRAKRVHQNAISQEPTVLANPQSAHNPEPQIRLKIASTRSAW